MDSHDRLTVSLYRASAATSAVGLVALAAGLFFGDGVNEAVLVVLAGALGSLVHLHLYSKRVRWVIQGAAALGAWLVAAGAIAQIALVLQAGVGFLFVAVSALAMKEAFCFRIPGLRAVGPLLAAGVGAWAFGADRAAAVLIGLAALPQLVLVVVKLRQPLHFDVGDRSRYEV